MPRSRTTLLPLADRTAAEPNPIQMYEYDSNGIVVILNVTAASGTGGLTVQLRGFTNEGTPVVFGAAPAAITATGARVYIFSPWNLSAAANGITAVTGVPLPQRFDVIVLHGDASLYTYSLLVEVF